MLKDNKAYIRAGAGIVYDSIAKNKFFETEKKMNTCLVAIRKAGGLK
jgi:anthranilate/para-aminobenzoate synthase component I